MASRPGGTTPGAAGRRSRSGCDGTTIAFDQVGEGPAVIVVGGGPTTRVVNTAVAELLAPSFSVLNYDRRGHGDSGDTPPFTVAREYEDLDALMTAAGGSAYVYGTSGGAMIALEAAARGLAITKLVVWEPPYVVDDTRPPVPADYLQQLVDLLAADRRGDMLELFFTRAANLPAEFVGPMRESPFWPAMEELAPTLVNDAMIIGDFSLPERGGDTRRARGDRHVLLLRPAPDDRLRPRYRVLVASSARSCRYRSSGRPAQVTGAAVLGSRGSPPPAAG